MILLRSGIGRLSKPKTLLTRRIAANCRQYHELSFPKDSRDPDQQVYERLQFHREDGGSMIEGDDHSVDMIAAPWNPADAMTVMGSYPTLSQTSTTTNRSRTSNNRLIAGHEGWGRRRGGGAFVVPARSGLGTLRSSIHSSASLDWITLHRGQELYDMLGPTAPAALFQTAGTAVRMLGSLPRGACVVQNAGNSAVGLMVSQWAAARCGARPVSLIRRGQRTAEQLAELMTFLHEYGRNEHVIIEEEMKKEGGLKGILRERGLPPPMLGINAVGGSSASSLMKALGDGGTLITYGGMSQQPIPASTFHLIFRNIHCEGYWHSRWMAQESTQIERERLMNDIVEAVLERTEVGGIQCPPHQVFPLADFREALQWDQSLETVRRKVVFDCRNLEG